MASINYAAREISVKIVYYGPGLSGKTTNLQVIHRKIPVEHKSDMVSLATETDRTLFFDFLPLDLGTIKGFSTKFQLYTVPGQVYYNATRKLVLRGVDGVVFVADSGADKIPENLESFQNLEDNLAEYHYKREELPIILQYNKRDLPNAMSIEELQQHINRYNLPWTESVANKGIGVFDALKLIGKIVIDNLNRKYSRLSRNISAPQAGAPQPGFGAARPMQPEPAPAPQPAGYHAQQNPSVPPRQQYFQGYPAQGQASTFPPNYQQPPVQMPPPAAPQQMRPQMPRPNIQYQMQVPPVQQPAAPGTRPYPTTSSYPMSGGYGAPQAGFALEGDAKKTNAPSPGAQQSYGFVTFEPLPIEPAQSQPAAPQTKPQSAGASRQFNAPAGTNPMQTTPEKQTVPAQQNPAPVSSPAPATSEPPLRGMGHAVVFPQKQQQRPARTQIDEKDYSVYHVDSSQQSFPKSPSSMSDLASAEDTDTNIRKKLNLPPNKPNKGFLSKFFNRDNE